MMNKLVNKLQTHTELESGTSLRVLNKPPVNATITDLSFTGKTYQDGIPTAAVPIPLTHTPSQFDLTSCGGNILPNTFTNSTAISGGVTITYDSVLQEFTLNGTGTVNADHYFNFTKPFIHRNGEIYTISRNVTNNITVSILKDYAYFPLNLSSSYLTKTVTYTQDLEITRINLFTFGTFLYDNVKLKVWLNKGSSALPFSFYTGLTQTFNVKDADNNTYQLGSLPDGKAATFNKYKINIPYKILTVTSGTDWTYSTEVYYPIIAFCTYRDYSNAWGETLGVTENAYCNIMNIGIDNVVYTAKIMRMSTYTSLQILVNKVDLSSYDDAGVQAWINAQIASKGNIKFWYEYATPVTYNTHPDEAIKFDNFSSVQDETNVFTNVTETVAPTIQCEIRKIGNKAYTTQNFYLTNGEQFYLTDGEPLEIII